MFEYAVTGKLTVVIKAGDYGDASAESVVAVCFYGDSNRLASTGSLIER